MENHKVNLTDGKVHGCTRGLLSRKVEFLFHANLIHLRYLYFLASLKFLLKDLALPNIRSMNYKIEFCAAKYLYAASIDMML